MNGSRPAPERLRVAIVAGTLGQGGAEKQLVYLVEALLLRGVDVRVLSLTRGDFFEPALRALGAEPVWVGRNSGTALRTLAIARALREFRPHVVQAAHFYVNLYVALAAPLCGAIGIGTARSDIVHEMDANGRWGPWLLRAPSALVVNSQVARRNAVALGCSEESVHVVPNAIDLRAFDESSFVTTRNECDGAPAIAIAVGSLVPAKRFDRFLRAVALARSNGASLRGVLVGDGDEREALLALAGELGLCPDGICFAGRRDDVPAMLRSAHIHVLTSHHEGFPNVLLEAMAAELPVVTTPAGDASALVDDGLTGYLVAHDDIEAMSGYLALLSSSRELRQRLGSAGRKKVEESYDCTSLGQRMLGAHRAIAVRLGNRRATAALDR